MTLRQALLGGWLLESVVSRGDIGAVRYPFGDQPSGLRLYTADGHMSAQLTPGPGGEFVSYGGRFEVNETAATVTHQVLIATLPELLLAPQIRSAQVEGDRLTLSARQTGAEGSTHSTVVWRRDR